MPAPAERWEADVGDLGVAHLDIPPDARRDRRFEVSVDFSVVAFTDADDAWHALRVLVDGAQQWTRRVPTLAEGGDGLDWRVQHLVPAGQPLRVAAITEVHRARRLKLRVVAEEA